MFRLLGPLSNLSIDISLAISAPSTESAHIPEELLSKNRSGPNCATPHPVKQRPTRKSHVASAGQEHRVPLAALTAQTRLRSSFRVTGLLAAAVPSPAMPA